MQAFLVSTGIVGLAEIGDKTQLLALVLAARFRKPWPIVLSILVATIANHAMAGALGAWVTTQLSPQNLRWILGFNPGLSHLNFGHVERRLQIAGIPSGASPFALNAQLFTLFLPELGQRNAPQAGQVRRCVVFAHQAGIFFKAHIE